MANKIINVIKKINREKFLSAVKFGFEVISIVATVVSVWLVFLTLEEMQIERHNSYRPNLCCIEKAYLIELNPDAKFGDFHNEAKVLNSVGFGDNREIMVELVNIGVGAMEDISITVAEEECHRVIDSFNNSMEYSKVICNDRELNIWGSDVVEFSDGTYWDFFTLNEVMNYPYLLPNAQQTVEYTLPSVHSCLVNAAIVELKEIGYDSVVDYVTIPDILAMVEYMDVQGIRYQEESVIRTEIGWLFGYGILITVTISPV